MTIIVGVHDPIRSETWIGTDRMLTYGGDTSLDPFRLRPLPPKWTVAGNWVLAFAGSSAVCRLFEREPAALALEPDIWALTRRIKDFLANQVVWNEKRRGDLPEVKAYGVIGSKDGLWMVSENLDPEPMQMWTTGAGEAHARGAMWAARELGLPILGQLELGIKAATKFSVYCGGAPAVGYMGPEGWTTVLA